MTKTGTDVATILTQRGVVVESRKHGWLNVRCPFCSDTATHGGFNTAGGGYYNCWRCGAHRLEEVFSALFGLSMEDAGELVRSNPGRLSITAVLNRREIEVTKPERIKMPGGELQREHYRYLNNRRFDPDRIVDRYQIKGTGFAGRWKFRIMIPIYMDGRLVSYQGRDITNRQKARYLTASDDESIISPLDLLYNLDRCLDRRVVLVEGVTDVWRLGDGVTATFGTSMTEAKLATLAERFSEILFLFDPEEQADDRAMSSAQRLSALGASVEIIDLEMDHDPGDMSSLETGYVRSELGLPLGGEYRE